MEMVEFFSVVGTSAFKVLVGFGLAAKFEMSVWEGFVSISTGGILGIMLYAYLGARLRDWVVARRRANKMVRHPDAKRIKRLRLYIKIWRRFGIYGIAFLTPPLISPPVGTAIALAFGEKPKRIVLFLGVSVCGWAIIFSLFGNVIQKWIL